MKRIIVSVTNDLVTDQRVSKVCSTLSELDFEILLIGRKLKNSFPFDSPYQSKRIKLVFNKGFLFYAEYNIRLFLILLVSKKDVLLSNDLDTLLPNYLISKFCKIPLVFDSHELFSEVPELVDRPLIQKFWKNLEDLLIPRLKNCNTVCNSIANYYNHRYQSKFNVIRNLPSINNEIEKSNFPFDTASKKIIIYQGAINKGRGLELIIETMSHLDNAILVIIGGGDIKKELVRKVDKLRLTNKIKFISTLSPDKLKKITPLADLGISIEEDLGLNYKFALPNKLFDYIHADLPVLVSDLPEMKKIVNTYKVGEVVSNRNPGAIAHQINSVLTKKNEGYYNQYLQTAKKDLNWDLESKKLRKMLTSLN